MDLPSWGWSFRPRRLSLPPLGVGGAFGWRNTKRRKKPFIGRQTVIAKFPWRTQNKALRSAHGRNHRKPHGTEPLAIQVSLHRGQNNHRTQDRGAHRRGAFLMLCPYCSDPTGVSHKTRVVETRSFWEPTSRYFYIERRRECPICSNRFTTTEKSPNVRKTPTISSIS